VKRYAIWLDIDITPKEVRAIFSQAGYHMSNDGLGRYVVDEVPAILRKDQPATNVVKMPGRRKKA
jgi:hypothetical protein